MTRPKGSFFHVILETDSPSHSQYEISIERMKKTPSEVAMDETTQDELFWDFPTSAVKLHQFFKHLDHHEISRALADDIILNLLLPILHACGELAHPAAVSQIIIASMPSLRHRATTSLGSLIRAILVTSDLIERVVTDVKGGLVVKGWLEHHGGIFQDPALLYSFTQRIMTLCESCTHDHQTSAISKRWEEILELKSSLESLNLEFERTQVTNAQECYSTAMASSLKRLDEDDKKTLKSQGSQPPVFPSIPSELSAALESIGIPVPRSQRSLQLAIERLKVEETFAVVKAAIDSFPCRPCHEAVSDARRSPNLKKDTDVTDLANQSLVPSFDPSIFGRRVGVWKVVLSAQAVKDVDNSDTGLIELLKTKLLELASGNWKGRSLSSPAGSESQKKKMKVPLLRVKCTKQMSILWQIDIGTYEELKSVRQLVKVWRIVGPEKLNKAVDQIIILQNSCGLELIRQCREKPLEKADQTYVPAKFEPTESVHSPFRFEEEEDAEEMKQYLLDMASKSRPLRYLYTPFFENQDLMKIDVDEFEIDRYYSLTEPLLKSLFVNDVASQYPFELSQEELRIVAHFETPTLVLGRSGTGKTTCLVFKILASYQLNQSRKGERAFRQVLLTRSPYLAAKLKGYLEALFETQVSQGTPDNAVWKGKTLQAADSTPEDTQTILSTHGERFPLICTVEQFLTLLENSMKVANRGNFLRLSASQHSQRVLDFRIFKNEYWCRFPSTITKFLSADLVFAEIMGVIKGSIGSGDALGAVSLEQYLNTSSRSASTFTTESERGQCYDLYERYEKYKTEQGDIDQVDRVIALLKAIKSTPSFDDTLKQSFHELYVDEVQDLRGIDMMLLASIIQDPRGIHLAGDTAQCISKDSTFRFAEIKDLFYRQYASSSKSIRHGEGASPTQFALSKNYRSHQGILDLATLVMKLLWNGMFLPPSIPPICDESSKSFTDLHSVAQGFPDTIDKLNPEFGQLYGPKPLIFVGFDAEILSTSMIGLVKLDDGLSDFGAEQVILVRDDEAKANLQSKIGDIALVLTILESKGMEFDDVLIYNFFTGGGHASSYRTLHVLLGQREKVFDAKRHAVLCSELKHLYVAVTRARKQLWLLESSVEMTVAVLHVLEHGAKEPLVEIVRPTDRNVVEKVKILRAGRSVDPRRWTDRGRQFLEQKNFSAALFCFKKGQDERNTKVAMAFLSEQKARTYKAKEDYEGFVKESENAIELFLQAQLVVDASKCLESLGDYDRAASLWYDMEEYEKAADIYQRGGLFEKASDCHHLNHNYDQAAEALRLGDLFDRLIVYTSQNLDLITPASCRRYGRLCNLLLNQGRISPGLRAIGIELLGSDETKELFLKEFQMTSQLANLYRTQGRDVDLFHLLIEDGQVGPALDVITTKNLYASIPERELGLLFNLVIAGRMWGNETELLSWLPRGWKTSAPPSLLDLSTAWDAASSVLVSIRKGDISIQLANIDNMTIKECVCIFVAVLLPDLLAKTPSILQLPVDILKEEVALVQRLTSEKGAASHSSLFIGCGIFIAPSQKQTVLSWSPLLHMIVSAIEPITITSTQEVALGWLRNNLWSTTAAFHEKARALWLLESPEPYCYKASSNTCQFSHKRVTFDGYSSKVNGLLRINSVFSDMTRLYYCRVMNDDFQRSFLPNRRHWLERLIRALTYVSAIDQDCLALMEAISALRYGQSYRTVVSALEDLIFYRLGSFKDNYKISNMSSALTECRFSLALGSQVHDRFVKAITRKMGYRAMTLPTGNQVQSALQAVCAFGNIQGAILGPDRQHLNHHFRAFLDSLKRTNTHGFLEFHAVVASYEFIATYLLYEKKGKEPVVLPQSWLVLHLSPILRHHMPDLAGTQKTTQMQRIRDLVLRFNNAPNLPGNPPLDQMQWIRNFVFSFCDLLEHLLKSMQDGFSFQFGTRPLHRNLILSRNLELLAVVVLNLGIDRVPAIGYREIFARVQKTFGMVPPIFRYIHLRNFETFMQDFVKHYERYDHKNGLVVVKPNGQQKFSTAINKIVELGADQCTLAQVISCNKAADMWTTPNLDDADTQQFSFEETNASLKILHFWRRYWPRKREARKFSLTFEAQVIDSYHDLIAGCEPSIKSKVAIRALFVTKGLKLQTQLAKMGDNIHSTQKILSELLADSTLPTSQLEDLQEPWSSFQGHKTAMEKIKIVWSKDTLKSQRWWLDPEKLEASIQRDLKTLKTIQKEVEGLSVVWKKVHDERWNDITEN